MPTTIQLPSGWLWIVTLFAPLIGGAIIKKGWDDRIKQLIAVGLSILLAVLIMWVDGSLVKLSFETLSVVLGSVFAVSELAYRQFWAPVILTTPVEKQATADVKQVLYVDKAVPIIEAGKPIVPPTTPPTELP